LDFRIPEIVSCANMSGFELEIIAGSCPETEGKGGNRSGVDSGGGDSSSSFEEPNTDHVSPFLVVAATEAQMQGLLARSVVVRFAIELWGRGASWKDCA
jgi:hypothetical protein